MHYVFTIYNVSADNLSQSDVDSPPGRTNLELSKPTFDGGWSEGTDWAKEKAESLSAGTYICIATRSDTTTPQGVWLFTVTEAQAVFIAVDFAAASVKAGA